MIRSLVRQMSSFPLNSLKQAATPPNTLTTTTTTTSAIQTKNNGVILKLHIKPGAKQSKITEISEQSIGMQIAAPPRDGEANEEVIRFVAELLGLRPRNIQLVGGLKSREKTVLVTNDGAISKEEVRKKLDMVLCKIL